MVYVWLKNLEGIKQLGLTGHPWMDGGDLKGLKVGLRTFCIDNTKYK